MIDCHPLTHMRDDESRYPVEYAIINRLETLVRIVLELDDWIDVKLLYDYGSYDVEKPETNRYGFIKVDGEKGELFVVKEYSRKKIIQQSKRNKKWEKMLSRSWEIFPPKKLEERIYKGVPDGYRARYWKRMLNVENIGQQLEEEYESSTQKYYRATCDKQLNLDVNRSFQFHYKYRTRYSGGQKELFNVVHALALHETRLEYVQGMTCAPSVFITLLDEKTAYAATLRLYQRKFRLDEMFCNFNFLKKCWNVTRKLIEQRHPLIAKRFQEFGIMDNPLPFFMFEWHYLWFIHSLRYELVVRIFDVILYEGFTALFSVADTIFYFIEDAILAETDPNILQQKMKTPLSMLTTPITTNTFMSHMYDHRIDGDALLAYFGR